MCEIITMGWRLARRVSYPKFCEVSPPKMRGVTPKNARRHPSKMRGVTPKNARRHPNTCEELPRKWRDGPSPFFKNNYFPEANQLRVLTVHEGHIGYYHHWRTDDSSSSCFCVIVNVGKMRGVTPTDANYPSVIIIYYFLFSFLVFKHIFFIIRHCRMFGNWPS